MLDSTVHAGWNKSHIKNLPLSPANPSDAAAVAAPYKSLWLPKSRNQDYFWNKMNAANLYGNGRPNAP